MYKLAQRTSGQTPLSHTMRYSVRYAQYDVAIPICQRCQDKHSHQGNVLLVFYALGWLVTTLMIFAIMNRPGEMFAFLFAAGFISFFLAPFTGIGLLATWSYCVDKDLWKAVMDDTSKQYPLARMLISKGWETNKPKIRSGDFKCTHAEDYQVDNLIDAYRREAHDAAESYAIWSQAK